MILHYIQHHTTNFMGKFDKEIPPFGGLLDFFFYSTVENPEMSNGTAAVRKYGEKDSQTMLVDEFIRYVQEKIAKKEEAF